MKCILHYGNIDSSSDYSDALKNIDTIVHCAAIVNRGLCDDSDFNEVNHLGVLNLATQAARAGVKRFIFLSSIKVSGESTVKEAPYYYSDDYSPEDEYARSKADAEVALIELSRDSTLEYVIIRPPLVYGPDVKSNFSSLARLVQTKLPLLS